MLGTDSRKSRTVPFSVSSCRSRSCSSSVVVTVVIVIIIILIFLSLLNSHVFVQAWVV